MGKKAVLLSKIAEKIHKRTEVNIWVAPQHVDLKSVCNSVAIPVISQHIDPIFPGSSTGDVLLESVREAGAIGTLINHSEHQLKLGDVEAIVSRLNEENMVSVVCTNNLLLSRAVATLNPSIIAYEPPELIGTGISVSKSKPEVVKNTIDAIKKLNPSTVVFCGAGITKGEDVYAALNLGAMGVLVSSGIVKTANPEKKLMTFANAIEKSIKSNPEISL